MAIDSGSLVGGGGAFVPSLISGWKQIGTGLSGDYIILTPPLGERVKLTGLIAGFTETTVEIDIAIKVNAVAVITGSLSGGALSVDGEFMVGVSVATPQFKQPGSISSITGGVDEVIAVNKTTGTTGDSTHYSYEFGVLA